MFRITKKADFNVWRRKSSASAQTEYHDLRQAITDFVALLKAGDNLPLTLSEDSYLKEYVDYVIAECNTDGRGCVVQEDSAMLDEMDNAAVLERLEYFLTF